MYRVWRYVHHVTDTTGGQPVQAGTDTLDGDDVQVSCAGVVCTVHDGTAVVLSVPNSFVSGSSADLIDFVGSRFEPCRRENVHWETQGHLELATGGTTAVRGPPSVKTFPSVFLPGLPSVVHLFQSSIQAVCGRLAVRRSGFVAHLSRVVPFFFGSSSNLRLGRLTTFCSARNSLD